MRALITGADGMLGSALVPLLSDNGYEVFPTDIVILNPKTQYLDVKDFNRIKSYVNKINPQIIFHLAAETNVDKCELETDHAYKVNTLGTENLALTCLKDNILMVYISTGSVFDGKKEKPYTEFDTPNPLNIYAQTKLEGERIIQKLLNKYYIVRAGWMIGGIDKDKKFVMKIINQLKNKKEILAVTDKIGSPTFTEDFSKCLLNLISTERYGLYHMANKGVCSRYDIAKMIVKFMAQDDVMVKPVTSEAFPLRAPRPRSEAIVNFKLDLLGINNMRPWEEALEEYIYSFKASKEIKKD